MKKFINLCLFSVSAAVLTAVPAAAAKKNAVAVPKEQAAKPAQKTVPMSTGTVTSAASTSAMKQEPQKSHQTVG